MAHDRNKRIQSMADLSLRLSEIVPQHQSSPAMQSPIRREPVGPAPTVTSAGGASRRSRIALMLGVGVVAAGGIGAWLIFNRDHAPSVSPPTPVAVAPPPAQPAAPITEPAAPTQPPVQPESNPALPPDTSSARVVGRPAGGEAEPHNQAVATAPSQPAPNPVSRTSAHTPPHTTPTPVHPHETEKAAPSGKSDPGSNVGRSEEVKPPIESKPVTPAPPKPPAAEINPPLPAPHPAQPKPGAIDVPATRAAMRPHLGAVQRCYERAKMDDLSLAGSVSIRITIGPDGTVTSATVASSTLGSPAAEHCITQEISSWHLPAPSGGVAAFLVYPFVFE
jgi:hypothetical protein